MASASDGVAGGPAASRTLALTAAAMLAFAANSLLCRAALDGPSIDAASFTAIRLASGAVMLWLVTRPAWRRVPRKPGGDWLSAGMLFVYAMAFSLAYLSLTAGTGALILFGFVQLTMFCAGLRAGERFSPLSWLGLALAAGGVALLVWPGVTAPPPVGAASMAAAGIAWGIYSLRGRGVANAVQATAGNFWRSVPFAAGASVVLAGGVQVSWAGAGLAAASGALTSALGYVVWYAALRGLDATRAATVQLSVPVIAALGGLVLLLEPITWRLGLCSAAVLGGIALVFLRRAG